ncbi:MAG TPA: serine hydrolase domain-containing protein [Pyrinomonadaceae bacterium]|nr:serine hydrolase domain-containing protein [Pyrinomonadaceae bacterium]
MRTLAVKLAFAALALFCFRGPAAADAVDDFVTSQMQKRHIPGLSLAVVKDGKVVKMRGYGLASVELGVPATEESVYQLASMTKSFTATAVMMLVEEGKLGLDDKISQHLGGLRADWGEVTIRHLLTHTSGVPGEALPWSMDTVGKFYPRDEYLKLIVNAPLQFAPGTRFVYGNSDYYLLAAIIEKAGGKPYGEFLSERIFKPLGMTATRVNDPWEVVKNRVNAYGWDNKLVAPLTFHPSQAVGSGNLLSSVSDLVKFEAALGAGRLLKKSSLEQMWTPARLKGGEETSYGLGWTVFNFRGHKIIGHGGNTIGFASQLSRFDDGTSVILLCNMFRGDDAPFKLSFRLAGFFIPDFAIPARPIVDTDPQFTERLRQLLAGVAEGKVDAALFSPKLRGAFSQDAINAMKQEYAQFGPLKSLSLLESKADGANRLLMYRAAFEKKTLLYYIEAAGGGLIDDFGKEPEDE